jgi:xylulokinase
MDLFLGIDAGTTALKAALFDLEGRLLALDRQEYQLLTPAPAWVELEPEVYWQALCRAVRNALGHSRLDAGSVRALAISSQGETLVTLDGEGRPTRPAIVWLDNRAVDEAKWLAGQFDIEEVYRITGQPEIAPGWPACKILWLKRHEPDAFARTARFLLLEDYLLYRLTGCFVTELALQTSSLLLDIRRKMWWEPMLDILGLSPDRLGRLVESGEVVGPLSRAGAQDLGLTRGALAVSGAMDQSAGAVGAGNIAPGLATESTGGALAILATLEEPRYDPQRRVPCHVHARQDAYCLLPWAQTAGMALRWFRDQFFDLERRAALDRGLDVYDEIARAAAQVPAGSDGLVVLPHLEGAACPEFNPAARAVFFGATLRHTRVHFVRAIMESVAYMLRVNLEIVEELGVPVREVRSMGGGAHSPLWLQIKADVLQKPLTPVAVEDAACLGAALMAATATGAHASLEEAVACMVRLGETVEPDAGRAEVYQQGYGQYLELYQRLAPMFG